MKDNPLVSVIMPYYNLDSYTHGAMQELIDDSVGSILSQSYPNWELIIVDHHSDEQTSVKMLSEVQQDDRVRVVQSDKAYFLPAARNFGIRQAKGELICCLDADDKYHPEFLTSCVELFNQDKDQSLGFVTTYFETFEQITGEVKLQKSNLELLFKNVPHVASMFRRAAWEKVGGYEENKEKLPGYQDWDFWLSIVERGFDWEVITSSLFYYRIRESSMLSGSRMKDTEMYKYLIAKHAKLVSQYPANILLEEARRIIINYDNTIKEIQKTPPAPKRSVGSLFGRIKSFIKPPSV